VKDAHRTFKVQGKVCLALVSFSKGLRLCLLTILKVMFTSLRFHLNLLFGRGESSDKMPFQQYAKYVGSQGKNINTLVTEMRMDDDSDTPKLVFKPVRFLNRDEWEIAKERRIPRR
jgi:hypothetical protein